MKRSTLENLTAAIVDADLELLCLFDEKDAIHCFRGEKAIAALSSRCCRQEVSALVVPNRVDTDAGTSGHLSYAKCTLHQSLFYTLEWSPESSVFRKRVVMESLAYNSPLIIFH